jgi:hypothetical protein
LIESVLSKWQKVFHIKCQKELAFVNGIAILTFVIIEEIASGAKTKSGYRNFFQEYGNLTGFRVRQEYSL